MEVVVRRALCLACFSLASVPALAQTVDGQGAVALTDTLSRYVSRTAFDSGVLKVAADGDVYRLDVNFNALAGLFPLPKGLKLEISPYALRLKPAADGTWQVDGALAPDGSFVADLPDTPRQSVQWSIADGRFSGVFDPALTAFSSASGSHGTIKLQTEDANGKGTTSYGAGTFVMSATAAAGGGVDFTSRQTMADYSDTRSFMDPGANVSFPVFIKAGSVSLEADGRGVKSRPLLDLLAFGVANADPERIKANQAQLKSLLLAALPLWDHVSGTYAFSDFSVTTPFGLGKAGRIDASVGMDGLRQAGSIGYGFKLSNVAVSSMFMPAWAIPLIPTEIDINFGGTNIDLDQPAREIIASLDLTQDPPVPESVTDQIAARFMANPPSFTLSRSSVRNAEMGIVVEGEMTFAGGQPEMRGVVEAEGYDKAVAALQAAAQSDPQFADLIPAAMLVKGYAKTLADGRLQWTVDARSDGSVLVNGVMVKPADPVAPETPQ